MGFIEDDTGKKERKIFSREDFNKVKFKEEDDFALEFKNCANVVVLAISIATTNKNFVFIYTNLIC